MDVDAGALRMLVRRWMCKGGGLTELQVVDVADAMY